MAWPRQKLASSPGALCGGLISTMRPAVLFAEEAMVKPAALNRRVVLTFFIGFTSGLKTTLASTLSDRH